jgi:hypothetical protein
MIEFNEIKTGDVIHGITRIAGQLDNDYFRIIKRTPKTLKTEIYYLRPDNTVFMIEKTIKLEDWNCYWLEFLKMSLSSEQKLAKILLKKNVVKNPN